MKTYPRYKCNPALMGCGGKGKPRRVIDDKRLMEYVGIGWIEIRKATAKDRRIYHRLVSLVGFLLLSVTCQGQALAPNVLDYDWLKVRTSGGSRPQDTVIYTEAKPVVIQADKNLWIITFPTTNLIGNEQSNQEH